MRTIVALSLVLASTASADELKRDAANHHIGDISFTAAFGRDPTAADSESQRMKLHLQYAHDMLAAKPATSPDLEKKRVATLANLQDYIAKGITPQNTHAAVRTPVFIDDYGNICAVGYLLEKSVGRALPEKIAKQHLYDYIEDIAAAVPEVNDWVKQSGFTLEEIASIQPGYERPAVEDWQRFNLAKRADGPYDHTVEYTDIHWHGKVKHHRMEGAWTVTLGDHVLGKGKLHNGAGTWESFDLDGRLMARGPFSKNDPHGTWTLFHPSGNVAARGTFTHGDRDGAWSFFYDTTKETPIAKGSFQRGSLSGQWRHFDADGSLLATSEQVPGRETYGWPFLTKIKAGADHVAHEIHTLGGVDNKRLDLFALDREHIYTWEGSAGRLMVDGSGHQLRKTDGAWVSTDCSWDKKRKRLASRGDVSRLNELIGWDRDDDCTPSPTRIIGKRAKRLDVIAAAIDKVRTPTPDFIKQLSLGKQRIEGFHDEVDDAEAPDTDDAEPAAEPEPVTDLRELIASGMGWYVEWPHIDGRFAQLFHTLPGSTITDLADDEAAAGD
jgi:hypothetical protein